jgi:hypothetical protein
LRQRVGGGTDEVALGGLAVTFTERIDYFDEPPSAPAWHRSSRDIDPFSTVSYSHAAITDHSRRSCR